MNYQERPIRVVESGQRVSAFELPLDDWHGYGFHLSRNPGKYSRFLLHSDSLPDLRFLTIMQNSDENFAKKGKNTQWPIWVEADQRHLLDINLAQEIGFRPAIFGGSGMTLRQTFQTEYWAKVNGLTLHYFIPEGEYLSLPNKAALDNGRLIFDKSTKAGGSDPTLWSIASDPNNEEYLRSIEIIFEFRKLNADEIPPQTPAPSFLHRPRRGFVLN